MRDGWAETTFGEAFNIQQGKTLAINKLKGGEYPVYGANGVVGYFDEYNFDFPVTGLGCRGSCGTIYHINEKAFLANNVMAIWEKDSSRIESRFIPLALTNVDLVASGAISGQVQPQITKQGLEPVPIKIPPLPEQKRIIDLISSVDSYTRALQLQVVKTETFRNALLTDTMKAISVESPIRFLGEIATSRLGKMLSETNGTSTGMQYPYLRNSNVRWGSLEISDLKKMNFSEKEKVEFSLKKNDVLICEGGEPGRAVVLEEDLPNIYFQKAIHRVRCGSTILPKFLYYWMLHLSQSGTLDIEATSTTIAHLTGEKLRKLKINLPTIATQSSLIDLLSEFDYLIAIGNQALARSAASRNAMLCDLLNGEHEISASYDKVMGAA